MNEADALSIMQGTIWTIVVAAGPAVLTAMVVGIIIALFQALTQIQEMTLTFVPKIIAVLVVLSLTATFIGLFQALTQVQEATLTFVPKILAVLVVMALTASFVGSQLFIFTEQVYARIETGH